MKTSSLTPWSNLYLGESKFNIGIKASRLCVIFYGWGLLGITFIGVLGFSPLKYSGFIALTALCLGLTFYQWVTVKWRFFFKYFTVNLSKICYLRLSTSLTQGSVGCLASTYLDDTESKKITDTVCHASIQLRASSLLPISESSPVKTLPQIRSKRLFKSSPKKTSKTSKTCAQLQKIEVTHNAKMLELAQSDTLNGEVSARSRICSIGVWLVIEVSDSAKVEVFNESMDLEGGVKIKKTKVLSIFSFFTTFLARLKKQVKGSNRKTFFLFKDNMSQLDFKRVCRLIQYVKYSTNSAHI